MITGPIASGKSAVARELGRALEGDQVRTEVIDLDILHDRIAATAVAPDASTWAMARREAAAAANAFARERIAVVVAEGSFNAVRDRAAFTADLEAGPAPIFVTLRVSYEEALRRAQGDPTRGRSRDPGFLGPYYARWREALADIPATDLVIDTEQTTVEAAAATIAREMLGGVWERPASSRIRPSGSPDQ